MSYIELFGYLQEGDPSKLCRMTVLTKLIILTNLHLKLLLQCCYKMHHWITFRLN